VIGIFDKGASVPHHRFKFFRNIFREIVSGTSNGIDNRSNGDTLLVNFRGSINPRGVGIGFNKIFDIVFIVQFYQFINILRDISYGIFLLI